MKALSDYLPKAKLKPYTPEQLEHAKQIVAAQNSLCVPNCPHCGGLGWVAVLDEGGNTTGKMQPCPNVDPVKLYPGQRYGLDEKERGLTWESIKPVGNILLGAKAVKTALQDGHGWIYLHGNYGVGKTHILKIAVAESLRSRRAAAYCRMAEILDNLRSAFSAKYQSEESEIRLDWWASLPVLAIDEFDRINQTEYAGERRFLLMDRRYEDAIRGKTITLIASNSEPGKLEGYLADRVMDNRFKVVNIQGESYRLGAE